MKLLIINQSTRHPAHRDNMKACLETWGKKESDQVKILNYFGSESEGDGKVTINNNIVNVNIKDGTVKYPNGKVFDSRGLRFITMLEYCLNNYPFEYLYRTTCTSYIDINNLLKFVKEQSKEKIYTGAWNLYDHRITFLSGFSVLMSRDTVSKMVENKDKYLNSEYVEDLATGNLLIHELKYIKSEDQDQRATSRNFRGKKTEDIFIDPYPMFCYRLSPAMVDCWYVLDKLIKDRDGV